MLFQDSQRLCSQENEEQWHAVRLRLPPPRRRPALERREAGAPGEPANHLHGPQAGGGQPADRGTCGTGERRWRKAACWPLEVHTRLHVQLSVLS